MKFVTNILTAMSSSIGLLLLIIPSALGKTCEPWTLGTNVICLSFFDTFDDMGPVLPDGQCNFNENLGYYIAKCSDENDQAIQMEKIHCDESCTTCTTIQPYVDLVLPVETDIEHGVCYTGKFNDIGVNAIGFIGDSCADCRGSAAPTITPMPTGSPTVTPQPTVTLKPTTSMSPTEYVCYVCPDGTNAIQNGDRDLPYTNLLGARDTCANLVESVEESTGLTPEECAKFQAYAGYCGCEGVSKINACSLCPDGSSPPNNNDAVASDESGTRLCSDIEDAVAHFPKDVCNDTDIMSRVTADAYRCGCPGAPLPQCPLCKGDKEDKCNLHMCTQSLLDQIPEDEDFSECNYFCNGRLRESTSFTPTFIFQNCASESLVWGCNKERVISAATIISKKVVSIVSVSVSALFLLAF